MKINFLGDSITEGACASVTEKRYSTLVCEMLGAEERNYGIGGTRIAKQKNPNPESWEDDKDFISRAPTMDKDADFVFVFGGTNDYGHGNVPLGNMTNETEYTFYGALKRLVQYLISTYGKEKLCFILPIHRYNENNPYGEGNKAVAGAPLSAYVQAEKEVFNHYGVEYLDFNQLFPVPKTNMGDELTQDGLHPNDAGHKILAEQLLCYLKRKFSSCNKKK